MTTVCIIPARMGSTRFPGKPLAPICGRPMIEHVYRRCRLNRSLDATYVATCDREIAQATEAFGGGVIMTSSSHERASDRVAEAAERTNADVIVMVQGDEPMIHPEMIDRAVDPLRKDLTIVCTNLAAPIRSMKEMMDPNTIKVVTAKNGDALYFSRQPIPSRTSNGLKQVCVIPFRRNFLFQYKTLEPTHLEIAESVDMLRILEHGFKVRMVITDYETHSVDTPADLALVERLLEADPLTKSYGVS
ncbi:MAG: 3-deoxy-manno-octulosonate cytidylyltransferase [Acidobacteria bacterium]|nr:MAG: 3-deoxy-manno-octulosonate cytidylyltransferase [Acidobacteriota bacterium]